MANLEDFLSASLTLFKNRVVRGLVDFGHVCLLVIDVFFWGRLQERSFSPIIVARRAPGVSSDRTRLLPETLCRGERENDKKDGREFVGLQDPCQERSDSVVFR